MENNTQPIEQKIIECARIAEKIGFSCALSIHTISAYNDAAAFRFPEGKPGRGVKRAFFRGWNNGYIAITKVKQEIAAGKIVFTKDDGSYDDILRGIVSMTYKSPITCQTT